MSDRSICTHNLKMQLNTAFDRSKENSLDVTSLAKAGQRMGNLKNF